MNQQPDFFFSNYPTPLRELCSFVYFLFTAFWMILLGLFAFSIYVIGPIVVACYITIALLRALGLYNS